MMKKYTLIILICALYITGYAQTTPAPPTGSVPYSNQILITPSGTMSTGSTAKGYRVILGDSTRFILNKLTNLPSQVGNVNITGAIKATKLRVSNQPSGNTLSGQLSIISGVGTYLDSTMTTGIASSITMGYSSLAVPANLYATASRNTFLLHAGNTKDWGIRSLYHPGISVVNSTFQQQPGASGNVAKGAVYYGTAAGAGTSGSGPSGALFDEFNLVDLTYDHTLRVNNASGVRITDLDLGINGNTFLYMNNGDGIHLPNGNWGIYSNTGYNHYLGTGNTLLNTLTDNGLTLQVNGGASVANAPVNPTDVVRKTEIDLKANTNGSNATGTWPISVTGNATGLSSSFNNIAYDGHFLATTPFAIYGTSANGISTFTPTAVKTYLSLQNVDNTTDVNKPVSTPQQTALNAKENLSNKQNSLTVDGSGNLYPTVDAVNFSLALKANLTTNTFTGIQNIKNNLFILDPNSNQAASMQYQSDGSGGYGGVIGVNHKFASTGSTTGQIISSPVDPGSGLSSGGIAQLQTGSGVLAYLSNISSSISANNTTYPVNAGGETWQSVTTRNNSTNTNIYLNSVNGSFTGYQTNGSNTSLNGGSYAIFGSGSKLDYNNYIYGSNPYNVWTNGAFRFTVSGNGNVGVGTASPASLLTITGGDTEVTTPGSGSILTAPNGSRWRVTVSNTGVLTTTAL